MGKFWSTFPDQFRRLRWKLTLSFFGVSILALLIAEIIGLVSLSIWVRKETRITRTMIIQELSTSSGADLGEQRLSEETHTNQLELSLAEYVSLASHFLSSAPPDIQGLAHLLSGFDSAGMVSEPFEIGSFSIQPANTHPLFLLYLDMDSQLIDSIPHDPPAGAAPGEQLDPDLIPGLAGPLQQALSGSRELESLVLQTGRNSVVGVVPIPDEDDPLQTVGWLAFEHQSRWLDLFRWDSISQQILIGLAVTTCLSGLFGILFGFLTARKLTSRLDRVAMSAKAWSQGNFSALVNDPNRDELSELGHTLNNMAVQMDNLLDERQEITIMEERNRLARELHDSVKQQAFAASAQLAAARARCDQNPPGAAQNLEEAERLVDDVRRELTDLIHELRPAALKGEGLVKATRQLAFETESLTGIPILVRVQGERTIPLEIEQTLYRVLQGGLSNVARHSSAEEVEIHLTYSQSEILLSVIDDGIGFLPEEESFGIGLKFIQERTELMNGTMEIISAPEKGTRLTIRIPINSLP